ncbi:2940_t:CDS:2 [Entrophospora sp. SA101]|nr:1257_t:CDS:2 [Entrophospora sp. SA101]CAJ0832888.1 22_t:CDS:2 [Entrophospora sp. SA101]CAJ0847674.1 2940_t:CDS:2 [Entrophospora sp. SA101]
MILYKLAVLGDCGVGKSALIRQLCNIYGATFQRDLSINAIIEDQPCVVEVLSTSGIEEYIGLRDQCIRDADGFLLVYSLISRPTFERIERHKDHIMRIKDSGKVPMILVGNKCDKIDKREVLREEGMNMAKALGCDFIETSAKTCVNVERSFCTAVLMIMLNIESKNVPLVLRIPDRLLMIRNRVMTMNQQYVELERQYVELEQQYVELGQDFIWLRCRDTINNTMDLNNQNM